MIWVATAKELRDDFDLMVAAHRAYSAHCDAVAEGQTILIIEAMKTMNQIPAPRAGRVKRILVDDGSPVEFGAPLIILE